jgi:hypothetical protein
MKKPPAGGLEIIFCLLTRLAFCLLMLGMVVYIRLTELHDGIGELQVPSTHFAVLI